jgi:cation diffusion facilitator family transporter
MSRKSDVAKLSVASNTLLIILKLVVGVMTGAVSIISEAIHSMMDLLAALIAYISVKVSGRPPDDSHPFGHEKIENISSVIETILIFAASIIIIKQAVMKLMHHTPVQSAGLGFAVMAVSAAVNYFVSRKLYAVARAEESVAIEADALHLKADVYTSLGVAAGLLILWVTGLHILDPIVAILIAVFIMKEAAELLLSSFGPLMDAQLSENEIGKIRDIMERYRDVFVDFHELRTRRSGNIKHIDLHMTTPSRMTVRDCHDLCDTIERDIEENIRNTRVLIHAEPCKTDCTACSLSNNNQYCSAK